nr:sugar ABC transporter ATP-binding protein [Actinomycetota bacterium]
NLHDVFEVADRVTVLRLGRNVGDYAVAETTQQAIVQAITAGIPATAASNGEPPV